MNTPDTTGQDSCIECNAGRYTSGTGGTGAADSGQCEQCLAGRFEDEAGSPSCNPCPQGRYHGSAGVRTTADDCTLCETGKYQDSTEGSSSCITCEAGRFHAEEGGTAAEQCTAW